MVYRGNRKSRGWAGRYSNYILDVMLKKRWKRHPTGSMMVFLDFLYLIQQSLCWCCCLLLRCHSSWFPLVQQPFVAIVDVVAYFFVATVHGSSSAATLCCASRCCCLLLCCHISWFLCSSGAITLCCACWCCCLFLRCHSSWILWCNNPDWCSCLLLWCNSLRFFLCSYTLILITSTLPQQSTSTTITIGHAWLYIESHIKPPSDPH